ncbi:hypothetical protein LUZ60_014568 [Juncus effusus]|nr:hypothetical protein LUZ60_014568 [Juncus effusus]
MKSYFSQVKKNVTERPGPGQDVKPKQKETDSTSEHCSADPPLLLSPFISLSLSAEVHYEESQSDEAKAKKLQDQSMALRMVKMSEEVWLTCVAHSLTTESEEIMGLLLGDITVSSGGSKIALIWGALPQMRSDRRKDRVETNPELLTAAAEQADIMSRTIGRTTRVIGWYHSHPHITVLPSHVDVRTQAMYQLMEPGFIGLIFSCFSEDSHKVGRIQVIAFQSLNGNNSNQNNQIISISSPVAIDVASSSSLSGLSSAEEHLMSVSASVASENAELDSADSARPLSLMSSNSFNNNNNNNKMDVDLYLVGNSNLDGDMMTDGMQEALHRSNLDVSGAEYVRKEIALQVLPVKNILNLESPLNSFTRMQHVLYHEERSAYNQAINHNLRDGKMHPLTYIHHTSTYHASLCKLMEYCLSPAINTLQDRLKQNEIRMGVLNAEAKVLEAEAQSRGVESSRKAPHHHQSFSPRSSSTRRKPPF